jgi:two-component system nitrogen regulation response regulator NtrX
VDEETVRLILPPGVAKPAAASPGLGSGTLAARLEAHEREIVLAELAQHGFNMAETARALGLERSHLYKKCSQLGIEKKS